MNINLRQARRLETEITSSLQALANQSGYTQISIHEDFDAVVAAKRAEVAANIDTEDKLSAIRFKLRKAIETANEAAGLNRLMNEEAELKDQQKRLGRYTDFVSDDALNVSKKRLEAIAKAKENPATAMGTDQITLNNVMAKESVDAYQEKIKANRRRILKIIEQLGVLNSTTMIEMTPGDAEVIEAAGIVVN